MMETKWTPGPWAYEIQPGYACITHERGSIAAASYAKLLDNSPLPMEANARLIAAAPDLYEALERLMQELIAQLYGNIIFIDTTKAMEQARAALAAARGEG